MILIIRHVTLEYEAACMDISLLDTGTEKASIAAVGLWTDISARILKLPSLEELNKEFIGGGTKIPFKFSEVTHKFSFLQKSFLGQFWSHVSTVSITCCVPWVMDPCFTLI